MKKLTAFSLIIVSSLLLSACVGPKNSPPADTDSSPVSQSTKDFSLRDLIAQNTPQKCLFSSQNRPENFEGEVIIHGPKFKQVSIPKLKPKMFKSTVLATVNIFIPGKSAPIPKTVLNLKWILINPIIRIPILTS